MSGCENIENMKEKIISNVELEYNSYFVGEFDRIEYTEVMMTSKSSTTRKSEKSRTHCEPSVA
jgi:hypothetical protein